MLFAGLHDRKHHGDQAWDILTDAPGVGAQLDVIL
jgi:hypothetical protein